MTGGPMLHNRLATVAAAAGLKRTSNGLWRRKRTGTPWRIAIGPLGNLTIACQQANREPGELLSAHSEWPGPGKLLREPGEPQSVVRRVDLFAAELFATEHIEMLGSDERAEADRLFARLVKTATRDDPNACHVEHWEPPPAKCLSDWMTAGGYEAAIDNEQNVRLAVKRRGCDGQIRVARRPGRLRLSMPIGQWSTLGPQAEQAMLMLAEEANNRTRLVRIAWLEEADSRRCEAQVDLTGLPFGDPPGAFESVLWKEMIHVALSGLELTLRRLGLELDALADAGNGKLVEMIDPCQRQNQEPAAKAPAAT